MGKDKKYSFIIQTRRIQQRVAITCHVLRGPYPLMYPNVANFYLFGGLKSFPRLVSSNFKNDAATLTHLSLSLSLAVSL